MQKPSTTDTRNQSNTVNDAVKTKQDIKERQYNQECTGVSEAETEQEEYTSKTFSPRTVGGEADPDDMQEVVELFGRIRQNR